MQRQADRTGTDRRWGVRDGLGIAGVILCLVVGTGLILLLTGLWKRFARETLPPLVGLPGGSWALGAALGVITVLGVIGGLRCTPGVPGGTHLARGLRSAGTAICCAAAFGPLFYLLAGLRTRNCRSMSCAYLPGTGTAFLAYVVTVGLVGWSIHRWTSTRAAEQLAREQMRVRRLRKKGKGKSRAARQR
ncbi:hypothetical protein [Streptomyces massasporeus]|uniref:hypothetical protein n=1 Tax=Streptomyces massasporeus TaxID=67324 RepID=UPI001674FBD5|nr:hypothetical protein [Streptomyces massasporeus]GGV76771.1 hypothetical protein GCM10010228_42360 [Streptomyces massasporeus]